MSETLRVRYVLISDYATVDHSGKLIVAGLYTEDLVLPKVPATVNALVMTVVAEAPAEKMRFTITMVAPSGALIMGGDGTIEPVVDTTGGRPRALLGFQFNQVTLPEGGDYRIIVDNPDVPKSQQDVHVLRVIVNPQAHAANMTVLSPLAGSS